jgi:hypothetical protein
MSKPKREPVSDTRSLTFLNLKPHVSGTLWRLTGAGREWTEGLFEYFADFDRELSLRSDSFLELITGTRISENGDKHLIPAVFCRQRNTDPLIDESAFVIALKDITKSDLTRNAYSLALSGLTYREFRAPPWVKTRKPGDDWDLTGSRWELIFFTFALPFILLSATGTHSHQKLIDAMNHRLAERMSDFWIDPAPSELLDEAFVGEATLQTNLRGLHRPDITRPDRKTLFGSDLRYALDPITDQSFAYAYGRAKLRLDALRVDRATTDIGKLIEEAFPRLGYQKPPSIGYAQADRSISLSSTPGIVDFARRVDLVRLLLDVTEKRLGKRKPGTPVFNDPVGLAFLSERVSPAELSAVEDPFEAQLSVTRNDASMIGNEYLGEAIEAWGARGTLLPGRVTIDRQGTFSVEIEASWQKSPLAKLLLFVQPDDERLKSQTKIISHETNGDPEMLEGLEILSRLLDAGTENPLELRFESGHVMADGNLYKPALKEILFGGWRWIKSTTDEGREYNVQAEKPDKWKFSSTTDPKTAIESSRSLFSRIARHVEEIFEVKKSSSSWALLCHDQPEEIADFIFIDAASSIRRVELIHVKAASSSGERKIAITPYEKVVPQAVKNLRHLDLKLLAERFEETKNRGQKLGTFCVFAEDRRVVIANNTDQFHDRLRTLLGFGPPRIAKVVCYAPHVLKHVWKDEERRRDSQTERPSRAAYMLSMLLLNAQSACSAFNASFEVWSDEAPSSDAVQPV